MSVLENCVLNRTILDVEGELTTGTENFLIDSNSLFLLDSNDENLEVLPE